MVTLTIITPAMDVHAGGCADIAKQLKRGWTKRSRAQAESTEDFTGRNFEEAVLAMDTELAAWFGEEPYQRDATAWSWANCQIAPCARKLQPKGFQHPNLRTEEGTTAKILGCQCGCGGQPKGKTSRFLPGHDMRIKKGGA